MDSTVTLERKIPSFLSSDELTFDYSRIDSKYHAAKDPNEVLTLYRGTRRIKDRNQGLQSLALINNTPEHVAEVKHIVESGDEKEIAKLIDRQTSVYPTMGMLCSSYSPEMAQVFAPTRLCAKKDKTLYQITLPANRCIIDAENIGKTHASREIFILGYVFPHEITGMKMVNDDQHSELLSEDGIWVRDLPDKVKPSLTVKQPSNWKYFS